MLGKYIRTEILYNTNKQSTGGEMNACVYDKTDKGREEIATRKYQVPPKLRTLLVMIDGRHSLDALLKNFAVLGLTEDCVKELLAQNYISLVSGPAANESGGPSQHERARQPAAAVASARIAARQRTLAAAQSVVAEAPAPAPVVVAQGDAERFRALYEFYNQTIKSTMGLRGLMLQLKVEKAGAIDDFRALRQPYLEGVLKARGREMTLSLRDRLDQLLGGRPEADSFLLPD
jgi:hypothetical protein